MVVYSLIRLYVFEGGLLKTLYGETYTRLSEINRKGFLNHHIAGITKIIILILAAYPFISVVFRKADYHTPFAPESSIKMGDVLIIVAQMLIGMYIFELIYRTKISPVSIVHHIGTIAIGQAAIAINLNLAREKDGSIEFLLCLVWGMSIRSVLISFIQGSTADMTTGAFDTVAELFPHVAIVLYRIYPTSHTFLAKVFGLACFLTLMGTLWETIVTMYLFGSLWDRWIIAFKIVTPLLHMAFSAAQLHGSWIFYKMWRKERRLIYQEKAASRNEERVVAAAG